jgi:hypothetical protein
MVLLAMPCTVASFLHPPRSRACRPLHGYEVSFGIGYDLPLCVGFGLLAM